MNAWGKIRVAKVDYIPGRAWQFDGIEGYENIIPLTEGTKHYKLSPYYLSNDMGQNMENIWQFSKVYQSVPNITWKAPKSYDGKEWNHQKETHVDEDGNLTNEYWQWREKGFNCPYPVRYPVGFYGRAKCLYAIESKNDQKKLGYIEARKRIYVNLYVTLVKKERMFWQLVEKIKNGQNVLIFDVDGPHQESLNYYKNKYNINDTFIQNGSIDARDENVINILLNDDKHPFGHGYCLALALISELKNS